MPTPSKQYEIVHTIKNRPVFWVFCAFAFAGLSVLVPNSTAQNADHLPGRAPGWVVLPVEEYRALHERAYPMEREPEPPPVEATLTRVDYDLRVVVRPTAGGESAGPIEIASGRATLTIDVLKDGWVRVPIPAGLLVREARLDGKLVSLVPGA